MERKLTATDVRKAFALHKQQNSPLTQLQNCETLPKEGGRGRGRGTRLLQKTLVNNEPIDSKLNTFAANESKSTDVIPTNTLIGTNDSYKDVICNNIQFQSDPIFEYVIQFEPSINEVAAHSLLNNYFKQIPQVFLCDKFSLFTPKELNKNCLRHTFPNTTMILTFKQKLNLNSHLLQLLFQNLDRKIFVRELEIIPNYVVALRHCKSGVLLCLDRRYYIGQLKTIGELISYCEHLYGEHYQESVAVYVNKTNIYCKQSNKTYKFVEICWDKRLVKAQNQSEYIFLAPEQCNIAEVVYNVSRYMLDTPMNLMMNIKQVLSLKSDWVRFSDMGRAKARVLEPETVLFGDGVKYIAKGGNWQEAMKENEVMMPVELCGWVIFYTAVDEARAKTFAVVIQKLQDDTGMKIGRPFFFEIKSETKKGYGDALTSIICKEIQLVVVIIPMSDNKPHVLIEYICCLRKPVPYQIVPSVDISKSGRMHEIAMQICAVLGGSPWMVNFPYDNWMICGVDVRAESNQTVCSFVASLSNDASQLYSKVFLQEFAVCLKVWLLDMIKKYRGTNGVFPKQVVIYQNCTEETRQQLNDQYTRFNFEEITKLSESDVCVVLVQGDTNMTFFKDLKKGPQNVPPGTVVDDTITNFNARDFFLVSHSASNTIVRPTHYEVIKDTRNLTQHEVQVLTYKMCHLYYKHAKTAEMPAHCLYAQKLGVLVAENIHKVPSAALDEFLYYL